MRSKLAQNICNALTLSIWLLNIFVFFCCWLPGVYRWNKAQEQYREAFERYQVMVGRMEGRDSK